jgi:spermidine synthase
MDKQTTPVLVAALAVATCGLVYELLAGTVAAWVLGDSVTQFSTVVGVYLAALGAGSYLSERLESQNLARRFVQVELGVALLGGLTTPVLFVLFAHPTAFRAALYAGVVACGTLVGLEVPVLLRLVSARAEFKTSVARVLSYDYAGSLLGSVLFSLVLMPRLGPLRTGVVFGLLNAGVGLWTTWFLRDELRGRVAALRAAGAGVVAVLLVALWKAGALVDAVDAAPTGPLRP